MHPNVRDGGGATDTQAQANAYQAHVGQALMGTLVVALIMRQ